ISADPKSACERLFCLRCADKDEAFAARSSTVLRSISIKYSLASRLNDGGTKCGSDTYAPLALLATRAIWMSDSPSSDSVPKTMRKLLAHRGTGYSSVPEI